MKTPIITCLLLASIQAHADNFVMHEWGTFTTVSASDGSLLPGLEKEEESLPRSVYSLDNFYQVVGAPVGSKGFMLDRPLENVTVKMETPVIYFYTDHAFKASVKVDFHGGSISQWYPQRSSGEKAQPFKLPTTKISAKEFMEAVQKESSGMKIDFAKKLEGSIGWEIDVIPSGAEDNASIFRGDETPTWLHPRMTDSALVRTSGGEMEKYLFYRGLGNFEQAVKFTSRQNGDLVATNNSKQAVPALFVFQNEGGKVKTLKFGPLAAGESNTVNTRGIPLQEAWQKSVYQTMSGILQDQGLYRKEAEAMVQTWWKSYFAHAGTRVFWILPQTELDAVLPLSVNPTPSKSVRVMVGRTEILTPEFEADLLAKFKAAEEEGAYNPWAGDRFSKPYAKRVSQLSTKTVKR